MSVMSQEPSGVASENSQGASLVTNTATAEALTNRPGSSHSSVAGSSQAPKTPNDSSKKRISNTPKRRKAPQDPAVLQDLLWMCLDRLQYARFDPHFAANQPSVTSINDIDSDQIMRFFAFFLALYDENLGFYAPNGNFAKSFQAFKHGFRTLGLSVELTKRAFLNTNKKPILPYFKMIIDKLSKRYGGVEDFLTAKDLPNFGELLRKYRQVETAGAPSTPVPAPNTARKVVPALKRRRKSVPSQAFLRKSVDDMAVPSSGFHHNGVPQKPTAATVATTTRVTAPRFANRSDHLGIQTLSSHPEHSFLEQSANRSMMINSASSLRTAPLGTPQQVSSSQPQTPTQVNPQKNALDDGADVIDEMISAEQDASVHHGLASTDNSIIKSTENLKYGDINDDDDDALSSTAEPPEIVNLSLTQASGQDNSGPTSNVAGASSSMQTVHENQETGQIGQENNNEDNENDMMDVEMDGSTRSVSPQKKHPHSQPKNNEIVSPISKVLTDVSNLLEMPSEDTAPKNEQNYLDIIQHQEEMLKKKEMNIQDLTQEVTNLKMTIDKWKQFNNVTKTPAAVRVGAPSLTHNTSNVKQQQQQQQEQNPRTPHQALAPQGTQTSAAKLGVTMNTPVHKMPEPSVTNTANPADKENLLPGVTRRCIIGGINFGEHVAADNLSSLTVIQLRKYLKKFDLKYTGKKSEMIERLKEHYHEYYVQGNVDSNISV